MRAWLGPITRGSPRLQLSEAFNTYSLFSTSFPVLSGTIFQDVGLLGVVHLLFLVTSASVSFSQLYLAHLFVFIPLSHFITRRFSFCSVMSAFSSCLVDAVSSPLSEGY